MDPIWWLVIGVVAGGAAGAAVVWALGARLGQGKAVAELKKENEQFRDRVSEHFVETAALINNLTDSYKAVFDHLSSGAEKLVDKKALAERMPRVSSREVTLKHIGAPEGSRGVRGSSGSERAGDSSRPAEPRNPVKKGAVRSSLHVKRPK